MRAARKRHECNTCGAVSRSVWRRGPAAWDWEAGCERGESLSLGGEAEPFRSSSTRTHSRSFSRLNRQSKQWWPQCTEVRAQSCGNAIINKCLIAECNRDSVLTTVITAETHAACAVTDRCHNCDSHVRVRVRVRVHVVAMCARESRALQPYVRALGSLETKQLNIPTALPRLLLGPSIQSHTHL